MTAYQLATRLIGPLRITIWKEYGKYHVRAYDVEKQERLFWHVFDTLKEAQKDLRENTA